MRPQTAIWQLVVVVVVLVHRLVVTLPSGLREPSTHTFSESYPNSDRKTKTKTNPVFEGIGQEGDCVGAAGGLPFLRFARNVLGALQVVGKEATSGRQAF